MPRHDRSYGTYVKPGSKGGSTRRKSSIGTGSSGRRRAGTSKYKAKRQSRDTG